MPKIRKYARKPISAVAKGLNKVANAVHTAPAQPRPLQTQRVAPWFADEGETKLRMEYPLTPSSIVFDLGGYEGQWASDINAMYDCKVHVFEPMPQYAENIRKRFAHNTDIHVYEFGLTDKDTTAKLSVDLASSSLYKPDENAIEIKLIDAIKFLEEEKIDHIDLMKINIEGGEYDLLDRLIESGWIDKITDLQIQFHDFAPDADARMAKIQTALRKTHFPTYQYEYVWENWTHRRSLPELAKQTPVVSVVMAVYNGEEYLPQAIESILTQSFPYFEFIILNDGSKDNSESVIKGYDDPRIRYYSHPNMGLAATLNRGLELAKGDLIARIDCDDVSLPTRLQQQVNYLRQHADVAVLGTSFDVVDDKLGYKETFTALTEPDDVERDFYVRNPIGHGTVMFRKDAIVEVGGYDATPGSIEDYELWWRVSEKYQIANLPESLYLWRVVETSMSNAGSEVRQKPIKDLMDHIWSRPITSPKRAEIKRRLRQYEESEPETVSARLAEQYVISLFAFAVALGSKGRRAESAKLMAILAELAPEQVRTFANLYYRNRSMRGMNLHLLARPLVVGRAVRKAMTIVSPGQPE